MAQTPDPGTPAAPAFTKSELWVEVYGARSVLPLESDSYRLGRAPSNQICHPEIAGLSREHLAIERNGNRWVVRDLGSTHGTQVNGDRISGPRTLSHGDRITAARVALIYRETAQPLTSAVVFSDVPTDTGGMITISESLQRLIESDDDEGGAHMRALITAGRELATHLPLDKLFDLILDLTVTVAGASRGALMTLEKDELQVRSTKGTGLRISSHVRDLVMQQKRSLLVRDAMADSSLGIHASIVHSQIRSMMAVPLQTDDRVIGMLYLDSPGIVKEFTKRDLSLLTVMANMATVRIENARLAEMEQAERLRAREMEHAAMIQRSMLPHHFRPFPDRTDFELHAEMIPAREVGGDLFDFFLLDPGRLGFVVGDVSGKGVPAALFMAIARTVLRSTAHHHDSAGACLTYVNQALVEQNAPGMFATLFYGILHTRTGMLEYANAGHNAPYLVSPDGTLRALKDLSGPMLGIFAGMRYLTRSTEVRPGEGLLVFTDGVTEARDRQDNFFEEARLEAYLTAHASLPAEELVSGLHSEVKRFEAGAPRADDVTVLALRRRMPAGE